MKRTLFTSFLILVTTILFSQQSRPFGLRMGMNLNEVSDVCHNIIHFTVGEGPYLYYLTPKNNSSLFKDYYVRIHPDMGLYFISAAGSVIYSDSIGTEINSAFSEFVLNISAIYGHYEIISYVDSRNNVSRNIYYAIWDRERGSNIPDDMSKIKVEINSYTSRMGVITIEYHSLDEPPFIEERKSTDYSVF